ncbi:MAG TPA: type I methionyl aminopeptidase [Lentisphaeria bacterium]|nr:MAG: type I methionyl aminopeptidase [Lentisphaerae bacterium GWF2_38_69]HBM15515.1 type I methionyl aminopeptidase [Lentisphaeria bacterium]
MPEKVVIHSKLEIEGIRRAGQAAAFVREELKKAIVPGITTKDLDEIARGLIDLTGGRSAFFGYRGFPGQICISLNDEVVHGIGRSDIFIDAGSVVSVDVGVVLEGFVGDTAESVYTGIPSEDIDRLLKKTRESLFAGINAAIEGNYIRDISEAVQRIAESANLGIVREYVGHGCGKKLHEPPEIPNYKTSNKGPRLQNGMVLAIEPMLNLGTHAVKTDADGWTVRTLDAKLSAHYEHMVLINDDKPEILTWPKK